MIYIKVIGTHVELAGTVANQAMLDDGYVSYTGPIPDSQYLMWDEATSQIVVDTAAEQQALNEAKENKKEEIRQAFNAEAVLPVTVNGVDYNGGYDSVVRLSVAKDLAASQGATTVDFYDASNQLQTVTLADADTIITTINSAFQTVFAKKQNLMVQIDSALTFADVDAIVW